MVKNLPAMQESCVYSLGQQDTWRRKWQPTPVFLPGEFHGQKSLTGNSPWGREESDTTKVTQQARTRIGKQDMPYAILCQPRAAFKGHGNIFTVVSGLYPQGTLYI